MSLGGRGWYWKVYGSWYTRKSVARDVTEFCGWDLLLKIVEECENTEYRASPVWGERAPESLVKRDKALIATLFETGGRVVEVLRLTRGNFSFDENWVYVTGMQVVKRYQRDRRTGLTRQVFTSRGRFAFPVDEPLAPYVKDWVEQQRDYIFPSPKTGRRHLTTVRAYQIVKSVGERLGL
ncbi:MAG: site-specific integrase, partial [Candidatus Brockarchaeota archaeon]|nr:site-specific integrase [Candidatus Brockarchaeota archaeon]